MAIINDAHFIDVKKEGLPSEPDYYLCKIKGDKLPFRILEFWVHDFDGRFAYQVPWSVSFMTDVKNHSMKSVNQSRLYIKEANSNNDKS